jgi:hypothetical protein
MADLIKELRVQHIQLDECTNRSVGTEPDPTAVLKSLPRNCVAAHDIAWHRRDVLSASACSAQYDPTWMPVDTSRGLGNWSQWWC